MPWNPAMGRRLWRRTPPAARENRRPLFPWGFRWNYSLPRRLCGSPGFAFSRKTGERNFVGTLIQFGTGRDLDAGWDFSHAGRPMGRPQIFPKPMARENAAYFQHYYSFDWGRDLDSRNSCAFYLVHHS